MKASKVSVLRERGLRPGVCRWAEPQCCERQFKQLLERKTDTMKNYILHPLPPVEAQSSSNTSTPTSLADVSSRGSSPSVLFIGLDVHNDSIAVSLAPSDSTEVRRYGVIGGSHDDVLKPAKKLQAAHASPRPLS